jgi:light-regulated signal transduction histidine kinase (bacteriophytochrome)
MPSPSESELAAVVIEHVADIAAGRCTITDEAIVEVAQTDPMLAEILTGLLFMHEDLALRAAQRDRALAEAETANRELEAFSYSVAHDLRAPLQSIGGFSQLLHEDYADKLDEEGRTYLRHVRESAQRMAQLIDDLLTLSRVARAALRSDTVDLSSLARDVLARLRRNGSDRRVEAVVEDGLVSVGDPGLLAIVLENLLGNAWKFTSKCRVARIEFRAQANQPVVYFVRDNGAGFDMAYAPKLFGVFERLHSADEFEGTGIGLATVQRIVHRHGGRVWAEGEVDRGATVYFTLGEEDQK